MLLPEQHLVRLGVFGLTFAELGLPTDHRHKVTMRPATTLWLQQPSHRTTWLFQLLLVAAVAWVSGSQMLTTGGPLLTQTLRQAITATVILAQYIVAIAAR